MKTVRGRLAIVVAFLVFALLVDRGAALLLGRILVSSEARFSCLYRGGMANDLLILGNSRGLSLSAPALSRQLNLQAFNLSYTDLSTEASEALLLDYLDKNQPPKLVLVELSGLVMDTGLVMPALLPYMGFSSRIQGLMERYNRANVVASALSGLYRFNGEAFLRVLYSWRQSDQNWVNQLVITPAGLEAVTAAPVSDIPLPTKVNLDALERIQALGRERGFGVKLVIAPYLPAQLARFGNWAAWIASIRGAVGEGSQILDYSAAVSDASSFADGVHCNHVGAAELAGLLVRDGVLGRPVPKQPER